MRALLRAPGMVVLLDGYNVTKDTRGLPGGTLAEQRRWLLGEAATVAARFDVQVVVVFDGAEYRPGEVRPPRGVRVVFSEPPEIGDDRIEALLRERPRTPTLVVSSDRDVQARATAVDANVTTAAAFLRAVGRSGPPTAASLSEAGARSSGPPPVTFPSTSSAPSQPSSATVVSSAQRLPSTSSSSPSRQRVNA